MNWELVRADWTHWKGYLKARWDRLTDSDLEGIAGNRASLIRRLREVYRVTEERADAELRDWERHQEPIEVQRRE